MAVLSVISQVIVGVAVLNVWLVRAQKSTPYRGGNAATIFEEFQVYGLPVWSVYVVGFFKVALAVCLLAGLWMPTMATIGGAGMAAFMLVAVLMHIKVSDPFQKAFPAALFFLLSLIPMLWGPGNLVKSFL